MVLAALLSLGNYALRAWRWRTYLSQFGHSVPPRFAALSFTAGFAYTLTPGKFGELARARYCAQLEIPLQHSAAAFFAERVLDLAAVALLGGMLILSLQYRGMVLLEVG